jgi:hypothetical protein
MTNTHSFHIPVMGIGFTIDTPLKVSPLGIDSVISLVDDILMEKMRKMYCDKYALPYVEVTDSTEDFRAKRITSYLNLINDLAKRKFEELKNATNAELEKYVNLLPETSAIKKKFVSLSEEYLDEAMGWLRKNLSMGSIDVNIMTKADKVNYQNGEALSSEYNDAHAALRGFVKSDLKSSIILSAGMNPRLYSYMEQFEEFLPDENSELNKKVVLKVSDYRSALIQGKFLAKKGIWISEFRIESGLNCGGHAFATDGYLLGPILAEFRDKREELISTMHDIYAAVLSQQGRRSPEKPLAVKFTAQGGVGTAEEHQFLLEHYNLDSIGWGTPFLLVPEIVNVDEVTLKKLVEAKEEDLYLSNISPLGVPFNNLRGNSKDESKLAFIEKGRPGSACPKEYVALNTEFSGKALCTASRKYQHLKLQQLDEAGLSAEQYKREYEKVVEKACICVGLGTAALIVNDMDRKTEGEGVSVCPGPNLAYFSRRMDLKEMIDHIYGRTNVISRTDRPHVFLKELSIYIKYLQDKIEDAKVSATGYQEKYFSTFITNLEEGINYYTSLAGHIMKSGRERTSQFINELERAKLVLERFHNEVQQLYAVV